MKHHPYRSPLQNAGPLKEITWPEVDFQLPPEGNRFPQQVHQHAKNSTYSYQVTYIMPPHQLFHVLELQAGRQEPAYQVNIYHFSVV